MHQTFMRIDEALFDRVFQPLCNSMADRFGIGRGATACYCLDIACLGWIISRAPGLSDDVMAWDAFPATCQAVILLVGLAGLTALRFLFRRPLRRGHGNPLRLSMRPHRAILLLMLIARLVQAPGFDLADIADLGMLLFTATALYIGACAERPPVRRVANRLANASAT